MGKYHQARDYSRMGIDLVEPFKYHIKFIFKSPDVLFIPIRIVPVVSKSYFDRVGEEQFVKNPVGTGPYKFVAWKPGEYIDIERYDGYWGAKPPIKAARFVFAKETTTRVAMLKAGDLYV